MKLTPILTFRIDGNGASFQNRLVHFVPQHRTLMESNFTSACGPAMARPPAAALSIVLVEDQHLLREILTDAIESTLGYRVIGSAKSGAEGVIVVNHVKPDLVVLDIGLPDIDGFEVARQVKRLSPGTRILLLSGRTDPLTIFRAERAQVNGFVDKGHGALNELGHAIREIANGRNFFSNVFQAARSARVADPLSFEKLLTNSEQRALGLIGRGMSDEEIGDVLNISTATAQKHRSHIMQKLGVQGTPKLIAFAQQSGFSLPHGVGHSRNPYAEGTS